MIFCCGCLCGSTDSLIRNFLKKCGYADWLGIPIETGKERSVRLIERLPKRPELDMLRSYLADRGKWAVIIGIDEESCRWSDLTMGGPKAQIEAQLLVEHYA